jgi:hypothetical protein
MKMIAKEYTCNKKKQFEEEWFFNQAFSIKWEVKSTSNNIILKFFMKKQKKKTFKL